MVWRHGPEAPVDRLVLLAVADFADDNTGRCWPSVARLASMCRMTERGVRNVLRRLEAGGYLETDISRGGRSATNRYRVVINPERECNKPGTPVQGLETENPERECRNPERECIKPGTAVPGNHQEPSRTIITARRRAREEGETRFGIPKTVADRLRAKYGIGDSEP